MRVLLATLLLSLTVVSFGQEAVPGEYVIRFKDVAKARAFFANAENRALGEYRMLRTPVGPMAVIKTPDGASQRTLRALTTNSAVAYVEPNYIYRVPAGMNRMDHHINRQAQRPNDDRFGELWGLENRGDNGGLAGIDINALKAWGVTKGRKEVIVAVIDTGIDYKHPDLAANIWVNQKEIPNNQKDDDGNGFVDDVYGYDFANKDNDPMDDNRHGTHCAGTIGAVHNNKVGVAGVMAEVKLMPVKFLTAGGGGSLAAAVEAIGYATKMGAHVMSNSWGGGGFSQAMYEAIRLAASRNQIFVAAAGNSRQDNDSRPTYPANYDLPNVISVAALDRTGKPASFTSFGKKTVHVAAPGVNILSTVPNGGYQSLSGTSMATPHVSGVVGLVLSREGLRSAPSMRDRLVNTSRKHKDMETISRSQGFVDALGALANRRLP